jgi:carboxymethylenebutenolidase
MGTIVDVDGVKAYRSEPIVPPKAALILIHEIWGLVEHITGIADRYAAEGYLVLAPDLLSDVGITPEVGLELHELRMEQDPEKQAGAQPRLREAFSTMKAPGFAEGALAKLRIVVDALAAEPGIDGRIAVLGFCFGGTYSLALAAADDRVRAAVPFYGSAPAPAAIADIRCPVLAFYGQNDANLIDALPGVQKAMADAGVDFTAKVYPDAGHAFFNDTNPHTYNAADAADAWARSLEFLRKTFAQ